jgi:hypothetical protein
MLKQLPNFYETLYVHFVPRSYSSLYILISCHTNTNMATMRTSAVGRQVMQGLQICVVTVLRKICKFVMVLFFAEFKTSMVVL